MISSKLSAHDIFIDIYFNLLRNNDSEGSKNVPEALMVFCSPKRWKGKVTEYYHNRLLLRALNLCSTFFRTGHVSVKSNNAGSRLAAADHVA